LVSYDPAFYIYALASACFGDPNPMVPALSTAVLIGFGDVPAFRAKKADFRQNAAFLRACRRSCARRRNEFSEVLHAADLSLQ
jgi:hypothetical protein